MRWIIVTVCVVAVVVIGLRELSNPLACSGCSGAAQLGEHERHDVWVAFPAAGAGSWDYWKVAHRTCSRDLLAGGDVGRSRLHSLARVFKTKPTAEAVAFAYSRWLAASVYPEGADELLAARAGCLQAFRDVGTTG